MIEPDCTTSWTSWDPTGCFWAELEQRRDAQINALELAAAVLGLATFGPLLRGATVRLWIDNSAGESQIKKGSARKWDHNRIVHHAWSLSLRFGFGLWVTS